MYVNIFATAYRRGVVRKITYSDFRESGSPQRIRTVFDFETKSGAPAGFDFVAQSTAE